MRMLTLLVSAVVALQSTNDTPVGKVVTLLEGLRTEVQTEGKSEATTYDKFACFCKDTTDTKSTAILDGQDTIDEESARLEEQTGLRNKLQTEIEELSHEIDVLTAEMAEATNTRQKELAVYEATEADLSKALASLDGAITAMKGSKPALLQIRNKLRRTLALADAMGLNVNKAVVLLQQPDLSAELPDADYEYHSDGIISTLEDLHKEFTDKKKEVDDEETRSVNAYDALMQAKNDQKSTAETTKQGKKEDKATAEGEIAAAQEALTDAQTALTDDLRYMKDLTAKCELKAREWDQRSTLRNKEIEALTSAINVIQEGVVTTDDVNQRAFIQGAGPSSYQEQDEEVITEETLEKTDDPANQEPEEMAADEESTEDAAASDIAMAASFLQYRASSFMAKESAATRAAQYLTMKARALSSPKLSAIAESVVADPFKKVKGLVQQLIERLLAESAAEATQKGWCDTELGKARQMGEFKLAAMKKLNVELEGLEAKRDQLDADTTRLGEEITQLNQDHSDASQLRADEKDENLTAIKRAKEGLAAVSNAITILKNFYKGEHGVGGANSASVSLLQASPVDEDAPEMTSGAYNGAQAGADNVIGLLDVIKSDYERTIKSTRQSEEEAHRDYVDFDQTTSASIGAKTTEKELKEADLAKTKSRIEAALEELLNERKLKDQSVKTLEELNPACVDTGMSYEERVEKRKQEIDALKNALCILGDKGPECA